MKMLSLFAIVVAAGMVGILAVPGHGTVAHPALAGTSLQGRVAPPFRLTDQFGRSASLSQFRGHPVVVTFLQAHCHQTCPLVADKLRQAVTQLGAGGRQVAILVVSADPEGDTVSAVRRFSRMHGMLHRWHYLVGTRQRLTHVWRSYYMYAPGKNAPPELRQMHTSALFLIDANGHERILLTGDPDERLLVRDLQILAGLPVASSASVAPAPEVQHPAPDFTLPDLAGNPLSLHTLQGKVVLVNFWATWCTPCRKEMPMLASWYRQWHNRGLVILGVDQQEGRHDIEGFLHSLHDVSYPIVLDQSGAVSARYNVVGLPTSFLVDRSGTIRVVHIGILSQNFLSHSIEPLVREHTHG